MTDQTNNDSSILRIAVGTTNPCKIDAVTKALRIVCTDVDIQVEGFSVESGVPDQPFGDEETIKGAKNRAMLAHRAYRDANKVFPHLSFGLEGGLEWSSNLLDHDDEKTLWCMAWMAVYGRRKSLLVDLMASNKSKCWQPDKKPIFSVAKTGKFMLPPTINKLIKEGMELGDADDTIFGRVRSKHGSGTVGYLTDGMIDRAAYYEHALILALVPWIRPDVYNSKGLLAPSLSPKDEDE